MAYLPLLLQLQTLDSERNVLNRAKEDAAKDQNLHALQFLAHELESALSKSGAELNTVRTNLRRAELDLKTTQDRIRAEEQKLYSGTITSSRELDQLQQKIEESHKSREKLEEETLRLMEADETLSRDVAALEKRLQSCRMETEALQREIGQKLKAIRIELEGLDDERAALLPQIPGEWIDRYQKISKAHHGVGIAKMKNNSCGACHVSISDALLQKAKRGEDKLIFCENCGRILFY